MRDDIKGGIKNALDRGETLEQAIRSFVNAGYNELEVKEAAEEFGGGAISMISPQVQAPSQKPQITQPQPVQPPGQIPVRAQATTQAQPLAIKTKKKGFSLKIIILIMILLILFGVLVGIIFFRGQIINFLTNLF